MAGLENQVLVAKNVNFDYTSNPPHNGIVTADGQLLIGSTANPNIAMVANTLTPGPGVSITNGPGSITIGLDGGGAAVDSFTTDINTPVVPDSNGNVNVTGATNIFSNGSISNTLRLELQGTNHALFVGRGAATASTSLATGSSGQVLQSAGASADPAFSTATYPSTATGTGTILRADGTNWVATTATYPATTTINQILYSSANNTVTGLATANRGVLTTGATGIPAITALATDGQLIIGSTAGAPAAATLTPGTGVSISNASNSITISATGGGLSWVVVSGTSQAMSVNTGYTANNAGLCTLTLPATAAVGDTIHVGGIGAGGWALAQNANQFIHVGSVTTTTGVGGSIASTNRYDQIMITCVVANNEWIARSIVGNLTVV